MNRGSMQIEDGWRLLCLFFASNDANLVADTQENLRR